MTRQIVRIQRPPDADARLDSFTTWCGETPATTSRFLRVFAVSAAAVSVAVVAWWWLG
jgi:hypothetical protein